MRVDAESRRAPGRRRPAGHRARPARRRERLGPVVRAVDQHRAVGGAHRGEQVHQPPGGVRRDAAPVARVQRADRAGEPATGTRRSRGRPSTTVARPDSCTGPSLHTARSGRSPAGKRRRTAAARFGLPISSSPSSSDGHPARQRAGDLAAGPAGQQLGEVLALVVAGAPAVHAAVPDVRLERGSIPFGQRPRRLHVVVPVDQHMRGARPGRPADVPRISGRPPVSTISGGQPAAPDEVRAVPGGGGEAGPVAAHARLPDPVRPLPHRLVPMRRHPPFQFRDHCPSLRAKSRVRFALLSLPPVAPLRHAPRVAIPAAHRGNKLVESID